MGERGSSRAESSSPDLLILSPLPHASPRASQALNTFPPLSCFSLAPPLIRPLTLCIPRIHERGVERGQSPRPSLHLHLPSPQVREQGQASCPSFQHGGAAGSDPVEDAIQILPHHRYSLGSRCRGGGGPHFWGRGILRGSVRRGGAYT